MENIIDSLDWDELEKSLMKSALVFGFNKEAHQNRPQLVRHAISGIVISLGITDVGKIKDEFRVRFNKNVPIETIHKHLKALVKNKYLIPGKTKEKRKRGQVFHSVYTWDGERLSIYKKVWFYHIAIPSMSMPQPQEPIPPQTSVSVSEEGTSDVDFDI